MPEELRPVSRHHPVRVFQPQLSSSLHQQLHHSPVPLPRRTVHRRPPLLVLRVDVGPQHQQRHDSWAAAGCGRVEQGSNSAPSLLLVHKVHVCAVSQERLDPLHVPDARLVQQLLPQLLRLPVARPEEGSR
eukprot:752133-Hanusia_phi.AAC.2